MTKSRHSVLAVLMLAVLAPVPRAAAIGGGCPAICELNQVDRLRCATYYVLRTSCSLVSWNFCVEDWCIEELDTTAFASTSERDLPATTDVVSCSSSGAIETPPQERRFEVVEVVEITPRS